MTLRYIIISLILGYSTLTSVINAEIAPISGNTVVNTPTIESVIAEIESNNLSLKTAAAANNAETAELQAANIIGPTSIEYSPFFQSGWRGVASSELIVKQEFDFPTKYASRAKAAGAKGKALDAALEEQRRSIRIEATQACIDRIGAEKRLEILNDRLKLTKILLNLYEQKYELRSATALDLNLIKLSKIDIERDITSTMTEAMEAEATLQRLNGGTPISLTGMDYAGSIEEVILPESARIYAAQSPSVAAAEADIRVSEAELSIARSSWLPTIGVGYRRNTEVGSSSNGFVIGLDFPIFGLGRQKKAAEARKAAAEISLLEADKNAEAEAASVMRQLESMRKTLATEDPALISETIHLYDESLRLGQITMTDYCRETESLLDRALTLSRIEQDYRRLAATLIQ
ncbi:MAG: TolC family protein [Muribaculaceae bacterium]|nr:TolC family protein [Muribaculaceae bacterium]